MLRTCGHVSQRPALLPACKSTGATFRAYQYVIHAPLQVVQDTDCTDHLVVMLLGGDSQRVGPAVYFPASLSPSAG